uniref:ParA family protein n=1 Tax=Ningiella ruwaisensis TaxID=2364274 RepID=UPI00109FF1CE|nr:ParA family protein [Ningiella ruwaisensis]
MQVWTVVNQKGGVGKTTTSISLAGSLASQGKRVLLVDLDPHASLTYYLGYDAEELEHSVFDIFIDEAASKNDLQSVKKAMLSSNIQSLTLLPSHIALATLDKRFSSEPGKGLVIKKCLKQFNGHFDIVIIDCPPVLGVLMVNGLVAADKIIIPTQTEHLALRGLSRMLSTIEQLKPTLKTTFKPEQDIKVVATLFDRRLNACVKSYSQMRHDYKETMWRGYIPVDTLFREASEKQIPICHLKANSRGAFAYDKLTNELLKDVA